MSKKRDKEISLSDKLSSLIQTKPSAIESDDDEFMTVDKVVPNYNDSDYSADELEVSKFRRVNKSLLEEDDTKYLGKGISRKELDSSGDSDAEENSFDECLDSQNEESDSDIETEKEESGSEAGQTSENEAEGEIKTNKNQESGNFNKEIFLKAASDIEKGKAIKNQLHLWNFFLECRMKFQECLLASNQFPNYKNFPEFKSRDPMFQDSVVQCKKSLKYLLNSLLNLQSVLQNSNEDFLSLNSNNKKLKDCAENENFDPLNEDEKSSTSPRILKKLNEFSAEISKRHSEFQNYRNNTIQKWNDRTRVGYIGNKNFSAFEQSTLKQIEHILLDKQRLIKRTQTKRLNYNILGEDQESPPNKKPFLQPREDSFDSKSKGFHKEIFDDDDFYHQLLSEMMKKKANDVTDSVQLGRHWMQLQKIRNKMKKTVDTKASKGRKVRFVVHPKLVNFMTPISNINYNEESKTELFNSLFGKSKK